MKLFNQKAEQPAAATDYALDEVLEIAKQGRRLAIYDRATNLYAYWYLELRAAEEIARCRRYGRAMFCVSLWAPAEQVAAVSGRLQTALREHDLAGYLNNGHFVVLLTETHAAGAAIAVERLTQGLLDIGAGTAAYPDDGETFDELLERAKASAGRLAA